VSSVRETFERNKEGLNDLFLKCKNEITENFNRLMIDGQFDEALNILNNQVSAAILEFEKRRNNVRQILETKLKLSFDVQNQGIVTEWENAVITVKSQLEMLADSLKAEFNKRVTTEVRIPAIEKFLINAANKKAFTRLPFDYVAKKLNVPENKVEEVAETLIFDGKLPARIDLVSKMLIFSDVIDKIDIIAPPTQSPSPQPSTELPPSQSHAPIPPAPKPSSPSFITEEEDLPQPISIDEPIPEAPQPVDLDTPIPDSPEAIDLSDLEAPEITEEILESTPSNVMNIEETDIEETEIKTPLSLPDTANETPSMPSSTETTIESPPIPSDDQKVALPALSEEEKEALDIISFFKSSVEELSEKELEERRRKREEKKRKLEEAKRAKQAKVLNIDENASDKAEIQGSMESEAERSSPENLLTCAICKKTVSKDDPSIVPCPHACGAYAHKNELLKLGYCPNCNEEIKEIDIEFSTLL